MDELKTNVLYFGDNLEILRVSKEEGEQLTMGRRKFNIGDRVIGNDKRLHLETVGAPWLNIGY